MALPVFVCFVCGCGYVCVSRYESPQTLYVPPEQADADELEFYVPGILPVDVTSFDVELGRMVPGTLPGEFVQETVYGTTNVSVLDATATQMRGRVVVTALYPVASRTVEVVILGDSQLEVPVFNAKPPAVSYDTPNMYAVLNFSVGALECCCKGCLDVYKCASPCGSSMSSVPFPPRYGAFRVDFRTRYNATVVGGPVAEFESEWTSMAGLRVDTSATFGAPNIVAADLAPTPLSSVNAVNVSAAPSSYSDDWSYSLQCMLTSRARGSDKPSTTDWQPCGLLHDLGWLDEGWYQVTARQTIGDGPALFASANATFNWTVAAAPAWAVDVRLHHFDLTDLCVGGCLCVCVCVSVCIFAHPASPLCQV